MAVATAHPISVEAYFDLELASEVRHDYCAGAIVAMTGGKPNHNLVAGNLFAILNFALRRKPYQAFITDQRLWIPAANRYTYPDVMVMAEPLVMQEGRSDTVMNPILVAEVLSRSTRADDLGDKFAAYQTIPTLVEYLALEQDSPQVQHWLKTEQGWVVREIVGMAGVVQLATITLDVMMADLYDKVKLNQPELND